MDVRIIRAPIIIYINNRLQSSIGCHARRTCSGACGTGSFRIERYILYKKIQNYTNLLWNILKRCVTIEKAKTESYSQHNMYKINQNMKTKLQEVRIMQKYVCEPCGYVYDPELGDPDNGVEPGTAFEDLPEDWVCPICGLGKDEFVPEEA